MLTARFLEVFSLGFLMALVPGPVVTSLFTESIRRGWRAARRIVLWAAAGELVMSVGCVAALSSIVDPRSPMLVALSACGALVLARLAWDLWRVRALGEGGEVFTNARVFTIAVLNGMAWVFWITVCTPQALELDGHVRFGRWLFIALFEGGWVVSTLVLCGVFMACRPFFRDERKLHLLYRAVAVLFVVFAARLGAGALTSAITSR